MRITPPIVCVLVMSLLSSRADAQQRDGLATGALPRQHVSKGIEDADSVSARVDASPVDVGPASTSLAAPTLPSYVAARNDSGGMFKQGPGRALVDGVAAGLFVGSVTHFIDSDAQVKAGLIGAAVVFLGELLWQQLQP